MTNEHDEAYDLDAQDSGEGLDGLDEQQLRKALTLIAGEVAQRDGPSAETGGLSSWWRRRTSFTIALAGLAAACIAIAAIVVATRPTSSSGTAGNAGARGLSYEQSIACSKLIVYGDVLSVRKSPHAGQVVVTVAVKTWVKPVRGSSHVTFETAPPGDTGMVPDPWAPRKGLLIHVSALRDRGVILNHGRMAKSELENFEKAAARAADVACPDWYRHPESSGGDGPAG